MFPSSSIVDHIPAEIACELLKKTVITLGKNKVNPGCKKVNEASFEKYHL